MITPQQLVEKILRDERMTATSNPWWTNTVFEGTAPSDLTTERNRVAYEAIKSVDRELRMRLFREAPRMLLETATFSIGSTEKPFPIPHMRYIALAIDDAGRRVPVVSAFAQPELSISRYKALGYSAPLKDAPYRLVITRPGYWKLMPVSSDQTITVSYIRDHGMIDMPLWFDWSVGAWVPTCAPVVTVTADSTDWCEALQAAPPGTVTPGYSVRIDYSASGGVYLLAYVPISLSSVRAGYNIEFWVKASVGTVISSFTGILSKSATCATLDATTSLVGVASGNDWHRVSWPITADMTGIATFGVKANIAPAVAGKVWINQIHYTQPLGTVALSGSEEYNENLLPLAVRAHLNADIRPDVADRQQARVNAMINDFTMNDGSGERPRRLRVRVPR